MKSAALFFIVVLLAAAGWAIAANGDKAGTEAPEPAFKPTESIRPDQAVAFPVDI